VRVGIYSPYDRSETALMALTTASTLQRQGVLVDWLAPRIRLPVSPMWDGRVRRMRVAADAARWGLRCRQRIWFVSDSAVFSRVKPIDQYADNILVASWGGLPDEGLGLLRAFNLVVCPSRYMAHRLDTIVGGINVYVQPFSLGLMPHCHPSPPHTALIYADGYTTRRYDRWLVALARQLDGLKGGNVLALDGTVDTGCRRALRDLRNTTCVFSPDFGVLLDVMAGARWFIDVSARPSAAMLATAAMSMGAVPICWKTATTKEIICADVDGLLVECGLRRQLSGAEIAVLDGRHTSPAAISVSALGDMNRWEMLRTNARGRALDTAGSAPSSFWQRITEERWRAQYSEQV